MNSVKSIIESLLFIASEPVEVEKISRVLKIDRKEIEKIIEELEKDYQDQGRGLTFIRKDKKIQFVTKRENAEYIRKFFEKEKEEELSLACFETLAIVSYRGPILKIEIEKIRGVDSSYILRKLLLRGLIEQVENPADLRLARYKITFDFLRYLGISKAEDLPNYLKMKEERVICNP